MWQDESLFDTANASVQKCANVDNFCPTHDPKLFKRVQYVTYTYPKTPIWAQLSLIHGLHSP
jgi:hypothetical protein